MNFPVSQTVDSNQSVAPQIIWELYRESFPQFPATHYKSTFIARDGGFRMHFP